MANINPGGGTPVVTHQPGNCSWFGWSGVTAAARTLSLVAEATISGSGGTVTNTLSYTLDGSTYVIFFSSSTLVESAPYSVAVPVGTNLANVRVRAISTATATGPTYSSASGSIAVSNLQIA